MKIFVPGRICLFGEHSDWAGGYRRITADIEKGYMLIRGTDQSIHAEVAPHPTSLVLTTTTPDGERLGPYEISMEPKALLEEAGKGVGSQGDGTAQFLARSAADRQAVIEISERDRRLSALNRRQSCVAA